MRSVWANLSLIWRLLLGLLVALTVILPLSRSLRGNNGHDSVEQEFAAQAILSGSEDDAADQIHLSFNWRSQRYEGEEKKIYVDAFQPVEGDLMIPEGNNWTIEVLIGGSPAAEQGISVKRTGRRYRLFPVVEYWYPGSYEIVFAISDGIITSREAVRFSVEWRFNFGQYGSGTFDDPRRLIRRPGDAPGTVSHISAIGAIRLDPNAMDLANGTTIQTIPLPGDLYPRIVGIRFRYLEYPHGGFQIAMSDAITVQLGDGNLYDLSIKTGDYYLGKDGQRKSKRHRDRDVIRLREPFVVDEDNWIWIEMYDDRIRLSRGSDRSETIIAQPISEREPSENPVIAFRSFGAMVDIYEIIIK